MSLIGKKVKMEVSSPDETNKEVYIGIVLDKFRGRTNDCYLIQTEECIESVACGHLKEILDQAPIMSAKKEGLPKIPKGLTKARALEGLISGKKIFHKEFMDGEWIMSAEDINSVVTRSGKLLPKVDVIKSIRENPNMSYGWSLVEEDVGLANDIPKEVRKIISSIPIPYKTGYTGMVVPLSVPVFMDFDRTKPLGLAKLKVNSDYVYMEADIENQDILVELSNSFCEFRLGGFMDRDSMKFSVNSIGVFVTSSKN